MSRYLVTGGCGFIGAKLVNTLLNRGDDVTILDNLSAGDKNNVPSYVEIIEEDVANVDAVRRAFAARIDGCFHLAANPSVAQSIEDYAGCHRTNLSGTIAVFDAAVKQSRYTGRHVPVVYASSCAVYGEASVIPSPEDLTTYPRSAYGVDKLCGELHARMAADAYDLKSVGLRFFNVFGPGQNPASAYSGVLSIFCDRLAAGEQVTIFGDGMQKRDFVFLDDVVNALTLAMERAADMSPNVMNVCHGVGQTLLDVGQHIADLSGATFEPIFAQERAGDIRISIGSPEKCRDVLGWRGETDFREGLRQTLDWMKGQASDAN